MFLLQADHSIPQCRLDAAHEEGCVTVPTIGAVGATGGALITTSADGFDIHPAAAVTLKL